MSNYDVSAPLTPTSVRPSAVQARTLAEIKEGGRLFGRFDVWGGYDWFLVRANGMTSRVARSTMQGLLDRGLIIKGEAVSVYSGRHETPYTISP